MVMNITKIKTDVIYRQMLRPNVRLVVSLRPQPLRPPIRLLPIQPHPRPHNFVNPINIVRTLLMRHIRFGGFGGNGFGGIGFGGNGFGGIRVLPYFIIYLPLIPNKN